VRSPARAEAVRAELARAGVTAGDELEFAAADLTADEGWPEALAGVDRVVHVASPVAPGHVEDEQRITGPAREGTLRVLRAARAAELARVVLTSAFHAVAWGHPHDDHVFTEADWTVLDGPGKARRVLEWDPRPSAEAVTAAARSMRDRGLLTA
jgi:nucleoside-diphosphate-sugar epimerase